MTTSANYFIVSSNCNNRSRHHSNISVIVRGCVTTRVSVCRNNGNIEQVTIDACRQIRRSECRLIVGIGVGVRTVSPSPVVSVVTTGRSNCSVHMNNIAFANHIVDSSCCNCYNRIVNNRSVEGVGVWWTTRTRDLAGDSNKVGVVTIGQQRRCCITCGVSTGNCHISTIDNFIPLEGRIVVREDSVCDSSFHCSCTAFADSSIVKCADHNIVCRDNRNLEGIRNSLTTRTSLSNNHSIGVDVIDGEDTSVQGRIGFANQDGLISVPLIAVLTETTLYCSNKHCVTTVANCLRICRSNNNVNNRIGNNQLVNMCRSCSATIGVSRNFNPVSEGIRL